MGTKQWVPMGPPPPRTDGWVRIHLPEVERLLREGGSEEDWDTLELPELHHGQYVLVDFIAYRPTAPRMRVHKLSQFADDGTLIAHPTDVPRHNYHLNTWCEATGMRENTAKREAILLGRLRREPQRAPTGVVEYDKYLPDGEELSDACSDFRVETGESLRRAGKGGADATPGVRPPRPS